MRILKQFLFGATLLLTAISVAAQGDDVCPSIVQTALNAADEACNDTGRNEVCYGNIQIEATAREDVSAFTFNELGDMVSVLDVQSMALSGYAEESEAWGVAIMRLQANIPDTLPGQNVTFVLFGDVQISDASADVEGDFSPMQAFYLQSGIGDSPCTDAPDSGVMVQTPEGVAEISVNVNGVDVTLGSTAYLQASAPDDEAENAEAMGMLTVNLLEGGSTITAEGETQTLVGGEKLSVPMTADLLPAGPPSEPEPLDMDAFPALPVNLLPDAIVDADSAGGDADAAAASLVIEPGTWTMGFTALEGCGLDSSMLAFMPQNSFDIASSDLEDFFGQAIAGGATGAPVSIEGIDMSVSNPEPNLFVATYNIEGAPFVLQYHYVSSTLLEFTMNFNDPAEGCEMNMSGTMQHAG
jgi:hypothetical protein